jgi:simple sugar transport system ATP-binding protein
MAEQLTKRFGNLTALDNVTLHLKPGTFHALLGENGAGKSTLVKCIMGFYLPDRGTVNIDGQARNIKNPRDAHKYHIGMVYQHFTSVPAMTVAENLVLSRTGGKLIINWKEEFDQLEAFMADAPFHLDLRMPIAQLAAGQKQKLEILKQLYLHSQILILDEPTSVLTPNEADEVLGLIRQEVVAKKLSVLLISHKFREVVNFCDEITVLRKGKFAGHGYVKDLNVEAMAEMMLGEKKQPHDVCKTTTTTPPSPALKIEQLKATKDNGQTAVNNLSLEVYGGEIVGIAGVSGNGQKELVEVLAGQRFRGAGEIFVNEQNYNATRQEMTAHRVHILPEEPLRNACVPNMSVGENMAMRTFDRPPHSIGGFLLVLRSIMSAARGLISAFSIHTPSEHTPIGNLSGGNVQRAVLARELSASHINLLVVANPCFGLDFNAVEFIHNAILDARNQGVAVLLVSEDLDELLKLSDRLVVMSAGEITYSSKAKEIDFAMLGKSMAGH